MKRFRVLVFVSLLILGMESQAGAMNWTWTDSTPTAEYFVALESTSYETDPDGRPNTNIIYFWQKIEHAPETGPDLSKISGDKSRDTKWSIWEKSIHLVDKTMSIHLVAFYDSEGRISGVFNFSKPICLAIPPHSLDDSQFRIIERYIRVHRNDVLLRTMEKVEKKKQKQNRNKEDTDKE